jgi:hypothetical protein
VGWGQRVKVWEAMESVLLALLGPRYRDFWICESTRPCRTPVWTSHTLGTPQGNRGWSREGILSPPCVPPGVHLGTWQPEELSQAEVRKKCAPR